MASKFRWGILSTAAIARTSMIPAIRQSANGEVVAIASRQADRAFVVASSLDIPRAYGSYEELLADPAVDGVYIPLPVSMHAEWSIRAARAGKHVLCEKPLAATAAEARRMVEEVSQCGCVLMEAFMYRLHPLTRRVKRLVEDGAVGTVRTMRASFSAPVYDDRDIRFSPQMGGGAMRDIGCYCVDVMRLMTDAEPLEVRAMSYVGPQSGVDEATAGVLRFPNGVLGFFACSFRTVYESSYDIIGDKGRILVDHGGMCHWPGADFTIKRWAGEQFEEIVVPAANHYRLIAEEFAAAVMEGRPPCISAESSVRNMEVIDAVLAAAGIAAA